jgi:TRAP-type C4-dicarboxylate transport system substrate-binding protein
MKKRKTIEPSPEWRALSEQTQRIGRELLELHARRQAELVTTLDEETMARIRARAEEILNEDPAERAERVRRMLAERLAYHEVMAERRREEAAPD